MVSNFIVSGTVLIGITVSIVLSTALSYAPLLMALSIGSLLYIILRDLLPHTIERVRHDGKMLTHIVMFILGISIMLAVASILPG